KSGGFTPGRAGAAGAETLARTPPAPPHNRSDGHQVADEDQSLAGRDPATARAPLPVGEVRRNGQLTAATDLHALHTLVPARDDLAGTELELQRRTPVPARVELLAGGERHTHVVHG